MTKLTSKEIFKAVREAGLARSEADVFSVIAYWEQIDGGVSIRGETYRYRTASEIADDTTYSERTVSRAVRRLTSIERWFSSYLNEVDRGKTGVDVVKIFWECLAIAINERELRQIEGPTDFVLQHAKKYLSYFEGVKLVKFSELDPCALAVWAYLKPSSLMHYFKSTTGAKSKPVSAYLLGTYGFVIPNILVERRKFELEQMKSEQETEEFLKRGMW